VKARRNERNWRETIKLRLPSHFNLDIRGGWMPPQVALFPTAMAQKKVPATETSSCPS